MTDFSEGDECPECGGYVTLIDDPALPPNLANAHCEEPDCRWMVEEVEV
jgi:hypothetical protein